MKIKERKNGMGKYFSLEELCRSDEAARRGLDNRPSDEVRIRLDGLVREVLDPIRRRWGFPIRVNSGYRSGELNAIVGGAANSQHVMGEAADITTGNPTENRQLFGMIIGMQSAGEISFDQLIDERNYCWLHISYRAGENRNQILHL